MIGGSYFKLDNLDKKINFLTEEVKLLFFIIYKTKYILIFFLNFHCIY